MSVAFEMTLEDSKMELESSRSKWEIYELESLRAESSSIELESYKTELEFSRMKMESLGRR